MASSQSKKTKNAGLLNLLTVLALLLTFLLCGAYAVIFVNPHAAINPFPPATETYTPSPLPPTFEPTWTPKPVTATATASPLPPTFTPPPTATLFVLGDTLTPSQTPSATNTLRPANLAYSANVEYFDSVTFKPASSCGDLIVAGRVLDAQSQHKQGYIVQLGGRVPGKAFNPPVSTLTGSATDFGPSGFEFVVGVPPVSSNQTLWVQLFDQQGAPLSAQIFISTFNDCKKNLILVGFRQ
ncbi:MAG: hypothetical protein Fur0035_21280 [Anaerolineales bacterium]